MLRSCAPTLYATFGQAPALAQSWCGSGFSHKHATAQVSFSKLTQIGRNTDLVNPSVFLPICVNFASLLTQKRGSMLLANKVALITGAGSGIGRATARLFAQQGARVVVVDVNAEGGQTTVDAIRAAGGDSIFLQTDVGKMEPVRAMIDAAYQHYGRLDIIHSNAAASIGGPAPEISEADWDWTIAVCLKATWMIAHCAVPRMLADGGGVMIITGSVHSIRGYANASAYQAAKGGVLALTRSLAIDHAPTLRVNAILPGAVETGLWKDVTPEQRQQIAQHCILRRNGQPEDIANVALFLASDLSAYMTGTYVVVDGGLTSVIETP
ncbi:MAG: SDR family oxidoreductase [Caldilinea sp. CFX5]|nr:SDR family oxidoreductase [Caldilinea sp. CFX5]